ncbi:hypothetical protein AK830_g4179 [Neonectria ditissima]|uniref:Uncharacterized protein n=1 Tax=Neonectria ditissima TaxID=78410 RepID=A0A0P7BNY6_9HYPO|nr:hypothetical protein AK830_g4179 [Neonectria ditissima]
MEGSRRQHNFRLSGSKLLQEIQEETALSNRTRSGNQALAPTTPVSTSSISSILTGFQITEQALSRGGVSEFPTLVSHHDSFTVWRYYTAPTSPLYLTVENLTRASRAVESLMNGLNFFMQKHAQEIKDLISGKGDANLLDSIALKQGPETRCFTEISKAICSFEKEHGERRAGRKSSDLTEHQLTKALLTLKLYLETNRFIILKDPEEPDMSKRRASLPEIGERIVDIAEKVLDITEASRGTSDKLYMPNPPTANPLLVVAHSGLTQASRRRAVKLLNRPQMVGTWDSLLSARLAEAMMQREETAAYDDWMRRVGEGELLLGAEERDENAPVQPMHRIISMTVSLTGRRKATISLKTWQEWMEGKLGQQSAIEW